MDRDLYEKIKDIPLDDYKICSRCKKLRPKTEFYSQKNECKECYKKKINENYR